MQLADAVRDDRVPVDLRRVPYVAVEPILGVSRMQAMHHAVTGDLGDHRCRGDGGGASVAADDRLVRHPAARQAEAVDQRDGSRRRDALHGAGQGPEIAAVSYTHLRAHETDSYLVCRLLLEKKK